MSPHSHIPILPPTAFCKIPFVRKSPNQPNHSVAQLFVNVHFVPVSNEKAATQQPTHSNQRKTLRLYRLAILSTSSSQRYATDFSTTFHAGPALFPSHCKSTTNKLYLQ